MTLRARRLVTGSRAGRSACSAVLPLVVVLVACGSTSHRSLIASSAVAACPESPVLRSTGGNVVERDGGAITVRMPPLAAGHETKALWRPTNGYGYQAPMLALTAERLDAPAPPIQGTLLHATLDRAGTIDGGYPSGIAVPTAGCWRFTAHLGSTDAVVTVRVSS